MVELGEGDVGDGAGDLDLVVEVEQGDGDRVGGVLEDVRGGDVAAGSGEQGAGGLGDEARVLGGLQRGRGGSG